MLYMSTINILEKLRQLPLFTLNELAIITGKNKHYLKVYVNRLMKKGLIFKLERGKFTVHDDPLIFSSHITYPSYISLWTALSYYHLTTQLPNEIDIAIKIKRKPIQFKKIKINFFSLPLFGFQKDNYRGFQIFIAEKEKLLIDCILADIPINQLDELMEDINIKKIYDYLMKIKNKSLIKRIGFILEEKKKSLNFIIDDDNYIPLIKGKRIKGKKNRKWRIIDNR